MLVGVFVAGTALLVGVLVRVLVGVLVGVLVTGTGVFVGVLAQPATTVMVPVISAWKLQ